MAIAFTWKGGSSGSWSTASNWTPLGPPTYGTISVAAGDTIILPSGGAGAIDGLVITGTGTVTFSGGSIKFNNGLAPPAGDNVTLTNTTFSTTSAFGGGGGSITLNGATVNATGAGATGTIIFDSVASGGAQNKLNIPSYSTGLTLQGLGYGDSVSVGSGTLSLTLNSGSTTVYSLKDGLLTLSTNVTLAPGMVASQFTSSGGALTYTGTAACFYTGTRLATVDGEMAVEDITAGTMLLTASGEAKAVRWLGRSIVSARFADPLTHLPIRIKAGALAENLPVRDLLVSPCHAMFIGGVLVQAGAMVNGSSIVREVNVPEVFNYYHVELATHELLLAEGAATESFVDNVDRMNFSNWAEHEAISDAPPMEEMDFPRAKSHRQAPMAVRQLLAERASALLKLEQAA